MDTDDTEIIGELTSLHTNFDKLRGILTSNKDLIHQVLNDSNNGTPLHIAAKYDTRNGTNITQFLLSEFNANPNIRNTGDSIPLYWALAEFNSCENPSLNAINSLMDHPKFKLYKKSSLRKSVMEFVMDFYSQSERGDKIIKILEEKYWRNRSSTILLYKQLRENYLLV